MVCCRMASWLHASMWWKMSTETHFHPALLVVVRAIADQRTHMGLLPCQTLKADETNRATMASQWPLRLSDTCRAAPALIG